MYFRLTAEVEDLWVLSARRQFELTAEGCLVTFFAGEGWPEHVDGRYRVTATRQEDPPRELISQFSELSRRTTPSSTPDDDLETLGFVTRPSQLTSLLEAMHLLLAASATRAINLIRWRSGLLGRARPLDRAVLRWSLDEQEWRKPVYAIGELPMSQRAFDIGLADRDRLGAIQVWLDEGIREPLAYELLREASSQLHESPRSCVISAVAAAEVGVKQFISESVPDAEWLVTNLESPNLKKLIRDYVPQLTKRSVAGEAVPKKLLTTVWAAVASRNQVAHRGADAPPLSELIELIDAVHDLLATLDWHRGESWAIHHMTATTQGALGIAPPD